MNKIPTIEQAQNALAKFLWTSFNSTELMIFLNGSVRDPNFTASLPSGDAPLQTIAWSAVRALARRNLLEKEFFIDLRMERPSFSKTINQIEEMFRQSSPPSNQQIPQTWVHTTTDDQHFAGRKSDLRRLDRWASDSSVKIIAVTGFGGMGKTSLVGHWLRGTEGWRHREELLGLLVWSFYADRSTDRLLTNLIDLANSIGIGTATETTINPNSLDFAIRGKVYGENNSTSGKASTGLDVIHGEISTESKAQSKNRPSSEDPASNTVLVKERASIDLLSEGKKLISNYPFLIVLDGLEVVQENRLAEATQQYGNFSTTGFVSYSWDFVDMAAMEV